MSLALLVSHTTRSRTMRWSNDHQRLHTSNVWLQTPETCKIISIPGVSIWSLCSFGSHIETNQRFKTSFIVMWKKFVPTAKNSIVGRDPWSPFSARPALAKFFSDIWYPNGTHFYCDSILLSRNATQKRHWKWHTFFHPRSFSIFDTSSRTLHFFTLKNQS